MKKIILLLAVMLSLVNVAIAQDATKILDKTSAAIKSAGSSKIGFSVKSDGEAMTGYIKLQGQKFVMNAAGQIVWFDGTTMWNYVKKNEEVNVTTPSAAEVSKMNPYSFLSFYKKGYSAKMGKSNAKEYEVILTAKEASAPYKQVVVRVSKSTSHPTFISMTSSKGGTMSVSCTSFAAKQNYTDATFRFDKKKFPKAEVIDLR